MRAKRYIIDTTLRDGEQSAGLAFTSDDKYKMAMRMDTLGFYQIEAGIPALGNVEKEAILRIMSDKKNTLISAWNRMNRGDIAHSFDCNPDIIHISAPVSYVQIYSKLRKNKKWLEKTLFDCIAFAQDKGFRVTVGLEDASRADESFLIALINHLKKYDVHHVRYADTVGVLTPTRSGEVINALTRYTDMDIDIHVHNDLGMAVANSLVCAKEGAKYIDCTFFGIGERAGNCNLLDFLHASEPIFDLGVDRSKAKQVQNEIKDIVLGCN